MIQDPPVPPGVDPAIPSAARIYDYILGGSYNFQSDRDAADKTLALVPERRDISIANRGFHGRAARWMVDHGIGQFLDLGSGLPTVGNTHEVVRAVNPGARVIYVDIDPMVSVCAADMLADPAITRVVMADLREPDAVLGHPDVRAMIDFAVPAGLLMTGVLHFVADESDPWGLVARYMRALAPGSYLAVSHATYDNVPTRGVQAGHEEYARSREQFHFRSRAQITRLLDGLEIVAPRKGAQPGLAYLGEWGAEDPLLADSDGSRWGYCAVARKP